MSKRLDITDEERQQISEGIENAFVFVQEVLDDPTILEHLPDGSHLKVIPRDQRDPAEHYDVSTPKIAVKVVSHSRLQQQR